MELHGMFHFLDFVNGSFSFSHGNWELSKLHEHIPKKFGGLLCNRVRSNENIEFLGPFFYLGFVFVESLQAINVNVGNFLSGTFFNMDSIGEDTNLNIRELDTLILL